MQIVWHLSFIPALFGHWPYGTHRRCGRISCLDSDGPSRLFPSSPPGYLCGISGPYGFLDKGVSWNENGNDGGNECIPRRRFPDLAFASSNSLDGGSNGMDKSDVLGSVGTTRDSCGLGLLGGLGVEESHVASPECSHRYLAGLQTCTVLTDRISLPTGSFICGLMMGFIAVPHQCTTPSELG